MKRHDIYSRCEPGRLLHSVLLGGIDYGRLDISMPNEPLQMSAIRAEPGKVFKAHYHIPKQCPPQHTTQEAWIIISGAVCITFYDTDGQQLDEVGLVAGDASITFGGGHRYMACTEGVSVYELKTGPYTDQQTDKVWL